ncbi:hypothetical protein [Streptomyces melanogenes]|uniref:hypothetical protein n=1 Tax=Streptomyces melanogenes TaxID=67326 RepID=UPI00167C8DB8|nr:hypothetical protein [Streptomyces melanogenes]
MDEEACADKEPAARPATVVKQRLKQAALFDYLSYKIPGELQLVLVRREFPEEIAPQARQLSLSRSPSAVRRYGGHLDERVQHACPPDGQKS